MLRKLPTWEASLDEITLENLAVNCIVGVLPQERIEPQQLDVSLRLFLDTRKAARLGSLNHSVDYAALGEEISSLLQRSRFRLLETAAEALCTYILAPAATDRPRARVVGAEVSLAKPVACSGTAVPGLRIRRHRSEINCRFETVAPGEVMVIHESSDGALYRLLLPPGTSSPVYLNRDAEVWEMPLSSGLVMHGQEVPAGEGRVCSPGQCRSWVNPTDELKSLLCVSRAGLDILEPATGAMPAGLSAAARASGKGDGPAGHPVP